MEAHIELPTLGRHKNENWLVKGDGSATSDQALVAVLQDIRDVLLDLYALAKEEKE